MMNEAMTLTEARERIRKALESWKSAGEIARALGITTD